MVVWSLLSTGMTMGAVQSDLQRQWPIDKLSSSVED